MERCRKANNEELLATPAMVNHELLRACQDADLQAVRSCVRRGAYLETRRPFKMTMERGTSGPWSGVGMTPLMHAANNGYSDICQVLLMAGANANAQDEDGMRPLHFAAKQGSAAACLVLLQHGAEVAAEDEDGRQAHDLVPEESMMTAEERRSWAQLLKRSEGDSHCNVENSLVCEGKAGMEKRPPPEPLRPDDACASKPPLG